MKPYGLLEQQPDRGAAGDGLPSPRIQPLQLVWAEA
jgi:hypothetical protein